MSNDTMPDLGRGNLTVRVIRGCYISSRKIDDSADFIGGMVGKRALDSNGVVVGQVCGDGDTPEGIFFNHKTTYFWVPISKESVTFVAGAAGMTQNLAHANLLAGSVLVTNSAGTVVYTITTDYTVNTTNGQITRTSTGSIAATQTVLVSYRYRDPDHSGLDNTIGTDKISIIKGIGEIGTKVYDTSNAISLNDDLKSSASGLLSTDATLTGPTIGKVSKPPTSDDAELLFDKIL